MANEVRLIDANALDPDLQKVVKEYKSNGAYEALCRLRSAPHHRLGKPASEGAVGAKERCNWFCTLFGLP